MTFKESNFLKRSYARFLVYFRKVPSIRSRPRAVLLAGIVVQKQRQIARAVEHLDDEDGSLVRVMVIEDHVARKPGNGNPAQS